MTAIHSNLSIEEHVMSLAATQAGKAERHLFHELNPGFAHSPILKNPTHPPRPASVMIPILERENGHHVLLTVRSSGMPSHAGEIGFPGGRPHTSDQTAIETAFRETHEEVGLQESDFSAYTSFGHHFGGLGFVVTPVVGIIPAPPKLKPCDREVAELFEVPLDHFLDLSNHTIIERQFLQGTYNMFAVPYQKDEQSRFIWGLTAGILHTFALAWHDLPLNQ